MQVGETPQKNIKIALNLSQTQFGLVTGTVFTFTNGICGLGWGHLSDSVSRKWPLTFCMIMMTFCAFAISFCHNFTQVLFARIGFAMFMSACVPISVSLICDYVLPNQRGRAQSFYACGMYLGVGLSSLSEILDEACGWRVAIRYIGLICGSFALMMFLLQEPKRNKTNQELIVAQIDSVEPSATYSGEVQSASDHGTFNADSDVSSEIQLVKIKKSLVSENPEEVTEALFKTEAKISLWQKCLLLAKNKCFVYLTIASFFRFWGGYSLGFLSATFFIHRYPENNTQYAYMASVIVIGGGLPSSFTGGYIADKFEDRYPAVKGMIAGLGALAATPFIFITYILQPGFWWAIISYYVAYFLAEMWYGPAHAQINNLFPSQFQGFACAVFNMSGTIAGTIATSVSSALYQKYDPKDSNPSNAGYILGCGVLFSYIACAPFFILSGLEYKKEYLKRKGQGLTAY